jgi:hypothetical protein
MKKKIITLGIVSIFLLTSIFVGNAIGEKVTEKASYAGKDLKIELRTLTSWSNPIGTIAIVGNVGSEAVYGPLTITLSIRRGFFGLFKFEEKTISILSENQSLNPGASAYSEEWEPDPSVSPGGIYHFKYTLNIEDDDANNNVDSQKYLIIHYRMFWFGKHDLV